MHGGALCYIIDKCVSMPVSTSVILTGYGQLRIITSSRPRINPGWQWCWREPSSKRLFPFTGHAVSSSESSLLGVLVIFTCCAKVARGYASPTPQ